MKLNNVVKTYEFEFVFRDQDGVEGWRHVIIQPKLDNPPEIDAGLEVVNAKLDIAALKEPKNTSATLITPDAYLPIKGTIKDDYGLTSAQWVYEVEPREFELDNNGHVVMKQVNLPGLRGKPSERRAGLVVSGLQFLPGQGVDLAAIPYLYWAWVVKEMRLDLAFKGDRGEGEKTADVFSFNFLRDEHSKRYNDEISLSRLESRLKKDPCEPCRSFREVSWKNETKERPYGTPAQFAKAVRYVLGERPIIDGFDLQLHLGRKVKSPDPKAAQMHYSLAFGCRPPTTTSIPARPRAVPRSRSISSSSPRRSCFPSSACRKPS